MFAGGRLRSTGGLSTGGVYGGGAFISVDVRLFKECELDPHELLIAYEGRLSNAALGTDRDSVGVLYLDDNGGVAYLDPAGGGGDVDTGVSSSTKRPQQRSLTVLIMPSGCSEGDKNMETEFSTSPTYRVSWCSTIRSAYADSCLIDTSCHEDTS